MDLKVRETHHAGCRETLKAGQVLVVLRDAKGKPTFIGGFFNNSDIAKEFRRILKSQLG